MNLNFILKNMGNHWKILSRWATWSEQCFPILTHWLTHSWFLPYLSPIVCSMLFKPTFTLLASVFKEETHYRPCLPYNSKSVYNYWNGTVFIYEQLRSFSTPLVLSLPHFGSLSGVVWIEMGAPEGTEIGFEPDSQWPGWVLDVTGNPVRQ